MAHLTQLGHESPEVSHEVSVANRHSPVSVQMDLLRHGKVSALSRLTSAQEKLVEDRVKKEWDRHSSKEDKEKRRKIHGRTKSIRAKTVAHSAKAAKLVEKKINAVRRMASQKGSALHPTVAASLLNALEDINDKINVAWFLHHKSKAELNKKVRQAAFDIKKRAQKYWVRYHKTGVYLTPETVEKKEKVRKIRNAGIGISILSWLL